MVEDGDAVPEPSSLDIAMDDPENRDGFAALIPFKAMPGPARSVRVNIILSEDVLAAIDTHAEAHGMNRSGFLAHAAKKEIGRGA